LRPLVQPLRIRPSRPARGVIPRALENAEERITEARKILKTINLIRKASGSIRKNADTLECECNAVQTGVDGPYEFQTPESPD
jgi:hypothetical protein